MKKYPEAKYLLLILKCFLKSRDLNETYNGGVSSYLATLMVISYLQNAYKTDKVKKGILLSQHLINFLYLYGIKFNYDDLGISIRKGGFYFDKKQKGSDFVGHGSGIQLCMENPQDPNINVGTGARNYGKVQMAF